MTKYDVGYLLGAWLLMATPFFAILGGMTIGLRQTKFKGKKLIEKKWMKVLSIVFFAIALFPVAFIAVWFAYEMLWTIDGALVFFGIPGGIAFLIARSERNPKIKRWFKVAYIAMFSVVALSILCTGLKFVFSHWI